MSTSRKLQVIMSSIFVTLLFIAVLSINVFTPKAVTVASDVLIGCTPGYWPCGT